MTGIPLIHFEVPENEGATTGKILQNLSLGPNYLFIESEKSGLTFIAVLKPDAQHSQASAKVTYLLCV
jgi:hypothetical protein